MPELPEVEIYARYFARHALRQRIAHVRVRSEITGDTREAMYAVLHFGGHDFSCGVRAWEDHPTYEAMKADLLRRYARLSLAGPFLDRPSVVLTHGPEHRPRQPLPGATVRDAADVDGEDLAAG